MTDVAYLVFDIETACDGRLIQRVRYPTQPQLSTTEAVQLYREQLLADTGSDFVPATFQMPVSVAIAKVAADYSLIELTSLDRPAFRPQVITKQFWQGYNHYRDATLVTFNGRSFDVPVMELAAYRYGVDIGPWMKNSGPSYLQPRNRYNHNCHLDLQDVMTNFGALRMNGGLDLLATILGKPGKMDTKGYMVHDLWEAGDGIRIDDYCHCDALDTYFVFLRTQVLSGRLDLAREQELVVQARQLITAKCAEVPALADYLASFTVWQPYQDDDAPQVR